MPAQRPLIRRPRLYDRLPQVPAWFCNVGHFAGKQRFRRKANASYRHEEVLHCGLCGGRNFTWIANQERHGLPTSVKLCNACAFMFTSPRWDSTSLSDHYRRDYRDIERGIIPDIHEFMFGLQESKGEILWPRIARVLAARGVTTPNVAEIGSGEGGLLNWIKNHSKASVTGFELNVDASDYGRTRGIDIRSDHFSPQSGAFDVIILEQVLEHIHDPSAFLSMVAETQQPGSLLFVGVPGLLNAMAHYDSNFLVYLDYAHMSHFCLHTLERLVARHGYRLLEGDETAYGLFERVSGVQPVTTTFRRAEEIVDYLARGEHEFRAKGNHLLRNARSYAKYMLVGLLSLWRRWRDDPLFRT